MTHALQKSSLNTVSMKKLLDEIQHMHKRITVLEPVLQEVFC